jgi:hypothetical protein
VFTEKSIKNPEMAQATPSTVIPYAANVHPVIIIAETAMYQEWNF